MVLGPAQWLVTCCEALGAVRHGRADKYPVARPLCEG